MAPRSSAEPPEPRAVSVVVIGAGYAGVMATNRLLASLTPGEADRVQVAVVNPRPEFVERIRLHELAAGSRSSVFLPLADTLHRDARPLVGTARRIDSDAHTVTVATDAGDITERYDFLMTHQAAQPPALCPAQRSMRTFSQT